jgi:hypothetical protein
MAPSRVKFNTIVLSTTINRIFYSSIIQMINVIDATLLAVGTSNKGLKEYMTRMNLGS